MFVEAELPDNSAIAAFKCLAMTGGGNAATNNRFVSPPGIPVSRTVRADCQW
jgi:hypothetical protein